MKKIISVLLASVLALSCLLSAAYAYEYESEFSDYPLIVVGGFSSSQLVRHNSDGTDEIVWYMDVNDVLETVKQKILPLLDSLGKLTVGDYDTIREFLSPYLYQFFGFMQVDHQGHSVEDIDPRIELTADSARWSNMVTEGDYTLDKHMTGYIDEDNTYICGSDFRLGAINNAKRLGVLIDNVLEATGAEKVNIIAQSYGGQLTGTYLSLDPEANGAKVNNVMMMVPALGGATLASDFLSGNLHVNMEELISYLEYGFMSESDFHYLFEQDWFYLANYLIAACFDDLMEIAGYWPSIWDFVPYGEYKDLIALRLDPEESSELIEQTTYFHENIMARYTENLQRAQAAGATISILAGYGLPAVTGSQVQSDAIIPTNSSTGATCAPYGTRFNDGYTCVGEETEVEGYTHISPSMEIDASTCYLPDNTWFMDNYFHGMENMTEYTRTLFIRQSVSTHPLKNVYEDKAYPQFHASENRSLIVHAQFDKSLEGYVSSEDRKLIVENDSVSPIAVTDIFVDGADVVIPLGTSRIIQPGKTASFNVTGELDKVGRKHMTVTVRYAQIGVSSITPVGQRSFDFTIMNGDPVPYDANTPTVQNRLYSGLAEKLDAKVAEDVLSNNGSIRVANLFYLLISRVTKLFRLLGALTVKRPAAI
ncbi:MAG: hypothetical protein IJM45_02750 [Clostridia bacterium]|nr:hypothetical protein [Clostridia bacterium]